MVIIMLCYRSLSLLLDICTWQSNGQLIISSPNLLTNTPPQIYPLSLLAMHINEENYCLSFNEFRPKTTRLSPPTFPYCLFSPSSSPFSTTIYTAPLPLQSFVRFSFQSISTYCCCRHQSYEALLQLKCHIRIIAGAGEKESVTVDCRFSYSSPAPQTALFLRFIYIL